MLAISPENTNSASDIVDFLKGHGSGMMVAYGGTGSGKSAFAHACESKLEELGMKGVLIDASKLPEDALSLGRIGADVYLFDEIRTGKNIFDMVSFVEHGHKVVFTYHCTDNEPSYVIESMKLALVDFCLNAYKNMPAEYAQESLDSLLQCFERVISTNKCLLFHTNFGSARFV